MPTPPSRLYPERIPPAEPVPVPEPSLAELVSDLRRESTELFRKEVQLARIEISDALTRVVTAISVFAVGGIVVFAGLLFLLAAAAFGLDTVLRTPWLSTLIVGAATIVIGAICFAIGKGKLTHLTPDRSLHSLQQDTELVQQHLPGGGS